MKIARLPSGITLSGWVLTLSLFFASCGQPDRSAQLKPLMERYVHAWNTGDVKGLEEVVSDQFELRMSPRFEPVRSLDSLKSSIARWRTAYPDFHINLEEALYSEGAVTIRWTIHATNSGPGLEPPTGKVVVVPGMSIIHMSAGKIIDEWVSANDLSWAEQQGYTLGPASASK